MKKIYLLLFFAIFSSQLAAQDWLSLFIGSANKYASVELGNFRKKLCSEYSISEKLLNDYYIRCGKNWGNVGVALEIAKSSGRNMRDVCRYYDKYHRHGWERVLKELGIRHGASCCDPFYERLHHHCVDWDDYYEDYCERHGKFHPKHPKHKKHYKKYKKHHKKHFRYDDDDDDDDYDD